MRHAAPEGTPGMPPVEVGMPAEMLPAFEAPSLAPPMLQESSPRHAQEDLLEHTAGTVELVADARAAVAEAYDVSHPQQSEDDRMAGASMSPAGDEGASGVVKKSAAIRDAYARSKIGQAMNQFDIPQGPSKIEIRNGSIVAIPEEPQPRIPILNGYLGGRARIPEFPPLDDKQRRALARLGTEVGTSWAYSEYDRIAIHPDGRSATRLDKDGVTRPINVTYAKAIRGAANMMHLSVREKTPPQHAPIKARVQEMLSPKETVHAHHELTESEKKEKAISELLVEIERSEADKHPTFLHRGRTQGALLEGYRQLLIARAKQYSSNDGEFAVRKEPKRDGSGNVVMTDRQYPADTKPFAVRQLESTSATSLALRFAEELPIILEAGDTSEIDELCKYAIHAQRAQVKKAYAHEGLKDPVLNPSTTAEIAANAAIDKLRPPLSWEDQDKFKSKKPGFMHSTSDRPQSKRLEDPHRTVIRGPFKKLRWKLGGGSH